MKVVFGVETPVNNKTRSYFQDTLNRMKGQNLAKNPYASAHMEQRTFEGKDNFFFILKPFYPEVFYFSPLPLIIYFLPVWSWLRITGLIIFLFMFSTYLFWNSDFNFLVLKAGAKKQGCNVAGWRLLSKNTIIERVVLWDK